MKDNAQGFSYVKALHTLEHKVDGPLDSNSVIQVKSEIPLPAILESKNMVMEIVAGDLQKFQTYYSNKLKVNILE